MARELIGDYIHLHYKNYLNNGTDFNNGEKPDINKIMNDQHEAVRQMYIKNTNIPTQQELNEISNLYNFMLDYETAQKVSEGIPKEDWDSMRQSFEDNLLYFLEEQKSGAGSWVVDMSEGSVRLKAENAGRKVKGVLKSLANVNKVLKQVIEMPKTLIKINKNVQKEVEEVTKLIKEIDNKMSEAETKFSQYILDGNLSAINKILLQYYGPESKEYVDRGIKTTKLRGKSYEYQSVSGNLIKLVSTIRQKTNTECAAAGMAAAGEIWGNLSFKALNNNILKNTHNLTIKSVEQINHSSNRTKKGTVSAKILGGQYSTKDGRYKESIVTSIGDNIIGETVINMNATEDKVDGIIEFYDGHSLTASIKNYKPHTVDIHGIGLLSGTGLLKFTQDYPTFLNHYLNITAEHKETNDEKPTEMDLRMAHEAMQITLGAVALAGGTYSNKNGAAVRERFADLFIINRQAGDQGQGKYEVYSSSALIDGLTKNAKLITSELKPSAPWPNEKYNNAGLSRYSNAYARCIKLLAHLHQVKIEVHASPELLA